MEKQEAIEFFAEFYRGDHRIPQGFPVPWGGGFTLIHQRGSLSTYDFDELTRLVKMAHDKCIRVEIEAEGKNKLRISIWKRKREGGMSERHPTLEEAMK